MDFSSITLFKGDDGKEVTFDTLLKDIYVTSRKKKEAIQAIIETTSSKIKTASDAALLGETIVEYLEVGVKNDDQLVKLAQIVQRATSRVNTSVEKDLLSEEEILELRQDATRILEQASIGSESPKVQYQP